jgi:hypothetical protein
MPDASWRRQGSNNTIGFSALNAFLNDELKSELGMKSKTEEEDDDAKFCSLKVPMDHEDKESKTYVVKVKKYDSGTSEEFLKWLLILNEQFKNHGDSANYDMAMNYPKQCWRDAVWKHFWMNDGPKKQKTKNKTRKAKDQTEYTSQQIYDCAVFELAIRAFDIQSGWRDAYERQREYMRRYLLMGKLNPEKLSQRLQDLNKYLDYIPIEI